MKNLKFAVIALFATAALSAQDLMMEQVPDNLITSFNKAYPTATNVEWELEEMNYKVEFDFNSIENEIWYSKEGIIVKIEKELTKNQLPSAISDVVQSKYPKYNIDEIELTEENGNNTYELELEKWFAKDVKIVITEDGNILRTK
ncbi:hypothetical protein ULMS_12180 [Patiriisocius marinistellae]|uniref:Putative beta-lactamase-inhibitor-like PepSY-like domain-containing protein n=1 Tax=Patiriisocius marinistellae TaxID=2494560 RepID=A0A5J4FUW4_9FLAO|nr:PepSY-like domain-containing protein [Patiriisocius marinistellae]GEQ85710.1 hypothetical protein ULMS_12180 [Patiriisocius marinistellae]